QLRFGENTMTTTFRTLKTAACAAATCLFVTGAGMAGTSAPPEASNVLSGRSSVYKNLNEGSLEELSTPDRISAVTKGRTAPTEIWRTLEHGERVECLSCIPDVSKLLYDGNAKTREIAAWWLRRRIFGVFGPGQVYPQLLEEI